MSKIVLGLVAAVFTLVSVATANDEAPAPKYFLGESWTYERTKEEVAPEMAQTVGGGREGPFKIEVSTEGLNLDLVFASSVPSVYEAAPRHGIPAWFKFPFKAGDTWPVQYLNPRGKWASGTVRVVAKETVKVRAGTFGAYKLIMEEDGGLKYDVEYWYAPIAKATVKVVQKRYRNRELKTLRQYELTSYEVHQ